MSKLSTELYRNTLFFLSWFLVLEVVAIALMVSTGEQEMLFPMVFLLIITFAALIVVVYRVKKVIEEQIS